MTKRQAEQTPFLIFGNGRTYDGDSPWWTLRFQQRLSVTDKDAVEEILNYRPMAQPSPTKTQAKKVLAKLLAPAVKCITWKNNRQAQYEVPGISFSSEPHWLKFYKETEKSFRTLHARFPLFAVFFQEGQFFGRGAKDLTRLQDEQLIQLHQRSTT